MQILQLYEISLSGYTYSFSLDKSTEAVAHPRMTCSCPLLVKVRVDTRKTIPVGDLKLGLPNRTLHLHTPGQQRAGSGTGAPRSLHMGSPFPGAALPFPRRRSHLDSLPLPGYFPQLEHSQPREQSGGRRADRNLGREPQPRSEPCPHPVVRGGRGPAGRGQPRLTPGRGRLDKDPLRLFGLCSPSQAGHGMLRTELLLKVTPLRQHVYGEVL